MAVRALRLLPVLFMCAASGSCRRAETPPATGGAAPSPTAAAKAPDPSKDLAYVCPMDPDMRSNQAGVCPRCGMMLVAGIPEPREFDLELTMSPKAPRPNEPVGLTFQVFDPWKHNPVTKFSLVHE